MNDLKFRTLRAWPIPCIENSECYILLGFLMVPRQLSMLTQFQFLRTKTWSVINGKSNVFFQPGCIGRKTSCPSLLSYLMVDYVVFAAMIIIEELIRRKADLIYVTDVHQKRVDDVRDHFGSKVNEL